MKLVYAFDVDETLEISNGPVKVQDLRNLKAKGHIVGICGNWAHFVYHVPDWHTFISFVGQMWMTKTQFLEQIKTYVKVDGYVMIGNDPTHYGGSNDIQAAKEANWTFIREDKWNITDKHVVNAEHNVLVTFNTEEFKWETDLDFIYVGIHCDKEGQNEIYRNDLDLSVIMNLDRIGEFYKEYNFISTDTPLSYVIWPHSKSMGWLTKIVKLI